MKTLYLVRHSKSDWVNKEINDIDRPLSDRGYRDAYHMSNLLVEKRNIPEIIITSPATRALSTAFIFARRLNISLEKIALKEGIYEARVEQFINMLQEIKDEHGAVMVFGHNSTITDLANQLGDCQIKLIPTSGVVCLDFNINSWKEINNNLGSLKFFEYPKKQL